MIKEPIAAAFDSIMELLTGLTKNDPRWQRGMDAARDLIPYISMERNGSMPFPD